MPKIKVTKPFRHCVGEDVDATEFQVTGQPIEVDPRTAQVAVENAWAEPVEEAKKPAAKDAGGGRGAKPAAPAKDAKGN